MILYPHQKIGVEFMLKREPCKGNKSKIFGSILADEMGLGKTVQTIGLIRASPLKTTILFCPTTLCNMWEEKIIEFAPEVKAKQFKQSGALKDLIDPDNKVVIICSYGICFRRKELYDFVFDRIVCDEAHYFRNPKSRMFKSLFKIKATTRLLLTGTPIQNSIRDIVTLIRFITQSPQTKFKLEFIKLFIKSRMLKRKITDVGIQMPKLSIDIVKVHPDRTNTDTLNFTSHFDYTCHLEKIIRRRQASVHPSTLNKSFTKKYELPEIKANNNKSDFIVQEVIQKNEPCLIFTEFKDEIVHIETKLREEKPEWNIASICGDTDQDERTLLANDKSINVLILQIQTAGVGLNLQHFKHAHFSNIQWNPSTTDQAIGRINRIGQLNDMSVFIYTLPDSIDQRINFVATEKREVIKEILSE